MVSAFWIMLKLRQFEKKCNLLIMRKKQHIDKWLGAIATLLLPELQGPGVQLPGTTEEAEGGSGGRRAWTFPSGILAATPLWGVTAKQRVGRWGFSQLVGSETQSLLSSLWENKTNAKQPRWFSKRSWRWWEAALQCRHCHVSSSLEKRPGDPRARKVRCSSHWFCTECIHFIQVLEILPVKQDFLIYWRPPQNDDFTMVS